MSKIAAVLACGLLAVNSIMGCRAKIVPNPYTLDTEVGKTDTPEEFSPSEMRFRSAAVFVCGSLMSEETLITTALPWATDSRAVK